MVRDVQINGECLIRVKGGTHYSGFPIARLSELGLAEGPVTVSPKWKHGQVNVDDFGPDIPTDILWQLASVDISFTLVHYDNIVLDRCMAESMGGWSFPLINNQGKVTGFTAAGVMGNAGRSLGKGLPLFASGNNFISVNLASPVLQDPWRFPSCYIPTPPLEFPLGTNKTLMQMTFRAIPYKPLYALVSSGGLVTSGSIPGAIIINGNNYAPGEIYSSGVVLWDNEVDTPGEVSVP